MKETEKSYRFIPGTCVFQDKKEKCPVEEGLEFIARVDGKDKFRISYIQHLNIVLAVCPVCQSHKSVKETE